MSDCLQQPFLCGDKAPQHTCVNISPFSTEQTVLKAYSLNICKGTIKNFVFIKTRNRKTLFLLFL